MIFGEVQAPPAVKEKLLRLANVDPRFTSLAFPPFIVIRSPRSIHPLLLTPRLQKGGCEALSLAAEIHASRVLMDEQAGPAAALKLGLNYIGLLGILIEARRQNLIPRLAPHLNRLQNEARFWFSQSLRIQPENRSSNHEIH